MWTSAAPEIADWLTTLQVEALAPSSTALPVSLVTSSAPITAPARLRRVQAEAEVRLRAGDVEGALRKMEWEERVLRAQGAIAEAIELRLARGILLVEEGAVDEARRVLRSAAWESGAVGAIRGEAADALGQLEPLETADHLARSAAYEAAGKPGLAARALRAAISEGVSDEAGLQLRVARLYYDERDYPSARSAFLRAAELQSEAELTAEAKLYAARSLFRTGTRSRSAALAEMRQVVENHPGTAAAVDVQCLSPLGSVGLRNAGHDSIGWPGPNRMMNLADMMIEIYAAESAILRAEKLMSLGDASGKISLAMARVYLYDAVDKISKAAKDAIAAFTSGDEQKIMMMGMRRFTKTDLLDTKALRREIADGVIAEEKYPSFY